jgi:adenylate kinase
LLCRGWVLYLVENKKIILVGIPGVGKTTLLTTMVEILKSNKKNVVVINYGSLMFDVATENGLTDRDQLRKLPVSEQQRLQKIAAEKIAGHEEEVVIIDTHAFISSPEGYYPGLPEHVLKIIKPDNFVSVSAKPEEIYNRRMKDDTRSRDNITLANIKKELDVQSGMISACAVITGSPVRLVLNGEGKIDETADKIIRAIGL